jgi:hypothetical protein
MTVNALTLAVAWTATFLGTHIVWTHLWALTAYLLHMEYTASTTSPAWVGHALGSAVMTGVAMTCSWYTTLIMHRDADFIGRAVTGWTKWITEELLPGIGLVSKSTRIPFDYTSVPMALRLGYHAGDLAVHFFPTFWLLQVHASVIAEAPRAYVAVGFLVTRIWCLHVSVHTLQFDFVAWRFRRVSHPSPPTPFIIDGALNKVYGLVPDLPPHVFVAAYQSEVAASTALVLVATCAAVAGAPLTPSFFSSLGGAALIGPDAMQGVARGFFALGGALICVAVLQIGGMVRATRRAGGGGGEGKGAKKTKSN